MLAVEDAVVADVAVDSSEASEASFQESTSRASLLFLPEEKSLTVPYLDRSFIKGSREEAEALSDLSVAVTAALAFFSSV